MNVLIYGAGALGLWFGFHLQQFASVYLVARDRIVRAVRLNGLNLQKDNSEYTRRLEISGEIEEEWPKPDLVLLAVKSYDVDESLRQIFKRFNRLPIVTIQNGVYAEEAASVVFGNDKVFPATVMIGARLVDDSTVEEFLNSGMKLGYLSDNAKGFAREVVDLFRRCNIACEFSDEIMRQKWFKLAFYCSCATINALTGVLDLSTPGVSWLVRSLLDEIGQLSLVLDLDFDLRKLVDDVFDFAMQFKPRSWKASVGEDLKKGKRTEIDYLNGYIVKLAEKNSLRVPLNRTLYTLVKTIETTNYFRIKPLKH